VNLVVEPGTVFGYLGPNGAGKSTTVKILCGMLADFGGEARVAGVDVRREPMEVKRRIVDQRYKSVIDGLYAGD